MESAKEISTIKPENPKEVKKKSLFSKAASAAKIFISGALGLGLSKEWLAGAILGTVESIFISNILPIPANKWIKSGLNALLAAGALGGINRYFDWRDNRVKKGTPLEIAQKLKNAEKRLKAERRIRSFFGGFAYATVINLAGISISETLNQASNAAVDGAHQIVEVGQQNVPVVETPLQTVSNSITGEVHSISDTVTSALGSAKHTVENAPGDILKSAENFVQENKKILR